MTNLEMPTWMSPKSAAVYCDMTPRTFRALLAAGLPYIRLKSGRIRVKRAWIDEFLEKGLEDPAAQINDAVAEVCRDLAGGRGRGD